ncbi:MAG: energy transducer TonB [Sphingosinicella sp.]
MAAETFLDRRTTSPTKLGLVIALHGAALAALALAPAAIHVIDRRGPIEIDLIELPPDPAPVSPPPSGERSSPAPAPTPVPIPFPLPGPTFDPLPHLPGAGTIDPPASPEPITDPVRVEAQFDPRYAASVQPTYPPIEHRAQREGMVRLRVTIGPDGRVRDVERLSATSDAFWQATGRHALSRWRFRPATLDGRPVESRKTLSVYFRLTDSA